MTRRARIMLRTGDPEDARRLHALITAAEDEGHLLPRSLEEVTQHAARFVVAVRNRKIVGCAELARSARRSRRCARLSSILRPEAWASAG